MDLLQTILTAAATSGLLVWLTRSWITSGVRNEVRREMERELDAQRASLTASHDAALGRLSAELASGAGRLGQERVLEAVTGMVERFEALRDLCAHYSAIRPRDMKGARYRWRDSLEREITAFERHFAPHRYALPRDTAERTDRTLRELERELVALLHVLGEGDGSDDGAAAVARSFRGMLERLVPVHADLEDHARQLLGVEGSAVVRD